jgi:CubicO group peptidase (beta-lactamase class C family)
MPAHVARVLAGLALIPLSGVSAQARRPAPATIARLVDSLSARAVADKIAPALGVAVVMDGRTILAKSYGMADVTNRIPATDNTLWYLASTTKSFTGFAVSLLANRGLLKFDTPITKLLPNVKWNPAVHADSITLARLISHTHYVNDDAVVQSAAFTGAIPESRWPELIQLAPPMPTRDLVYSNFGYNVAAMVIDRLRPEGWRKFLETNIYKPVGLRETYTRVSGIEPTRIAQPADMTASGNYVSAPFFKTDRTMNSAGGHLMTLRDLARWTIVQMDSGVIDGKRVFPKSAILRSQSLLAKHTVDRSKKFAFFDREGWGAGWDIGTYEGERMVSRFGSYAQTRSHLSFLPNRRIGVVAMSTGGPSVVTDVIAAFAYDLEAGRADARERADARLNDLRRTIANAPAALARQDSVRAARNAQPLLHPWEMFEGTYTEPSYGSMVFKMCGGKLQYRWGDVYGPVEIYDASKNQMRISIAASGNVVEFGFPAAGPAETARLSGIVFKRGVPDGRGCPKVKGQ